MSMGAITGMVPLVIGGGVVMKMSEAALGKPTRKRRSTRAKARVKRRTWQKQVRRRGMKKHLPNGHMPKSKMARRLLPPGGDYRNVGLGEVG